MTQRFPIHFGRFNTVFMGALGLTRRRSYAELDGETDTLRVRMSWGFRADVHRRAITGSERHGKYVWSGWGVHGWRGWWLVNGSGHTIVKIHIDPPARARVLGLPVKLRELWISLDDPDGFLDAISR